MAELFIGVMIEAFGAVAVFFVSSLLRRWLSGPAIPTS